MIEYPVGTPLEIHSSKVANYYLQIKKNKVMETKKFSISFILALLISLGLFADHVQVDDAGTVSKNYYWENSRTEKLIAYDAIVPELFSTKTFNGTDLYYVFNVNRNDGFVIVAADDNVSPILGYSFTGKWSGQNVPPALQMILEAFEEQVTAVIDQRLMADKEIEDQWEQYSKFNPSPPSPKSVSPLLSTKWNQNQYYNEQCPAIAIGPGGHAYAGCAAVSMAQVMNYWQHPATGTGSHSYFHLNFGWQSVNFGNTTYNYSLMPNSISSTNFEVAQLMYHCGVAIDMNYGATGSAPYGANWDIDVENALKNYFSYSSTLTWKWKNNFNVTTWISMLKAELDLGRPLIYYGWDGASNAHQFNCDGYNNNNYFHFNMGWSGSYDGYYAVTLLNPYYNYTYSQAAIFNLFPVAITQNLDFGDAPDPGYPTKLNSNGACHVVTSPPGLFLGLLVDYEPDGQPDVNCAGDDNDILYSPGFDDEDGVIFPALAVGTSVVLNVNAYGSAFLQGWMDFNQDGDWADAGEQIISNQTLVYGNNTLTLNIPASAYTGWTYARFRYSTQYNLGFNGQAPDGEVEDYFVRIEEMIPVQEFDMLFSLDIGSDTELSDPVMDMDEVFDPGDAYLFNGAYMALPGADGYFDDVQAFGVDPLPDGSIPGTGAPCLSGIPIDQLKPDYFDMDGIDLIEADLRQYVFGEGQPSVEKFSDPFVYVPDSMYISFDDDDAWAYSDASGSIPRLGFSSAGMLYGEQTAKDEILEVDLNIIVPHQAQIMSIVPKYNELPIHPNLTPDPSWASSNPNDHDDDVDALDIPYELDDAARTYFSADHEAIYTDFNGNPLNPGSIYLAEGGKAYEVINAQTDIGLSPDTDVDAFEFAWLFDDQNQYNALALVFSVDEDDPMTGVDESGGLMPNTLYMTFMTGWWMDFTIEHFEDDIDAITFFATPGAQQVPKADFSPLNSIIYAGQAIIFTDLSTNNPNNWAWSFYGGNPPSFMGQTPPPVVYPNPGIFQVDLNVSNAVGTDLKTGLVQVLPANWQYVPTNLSHTISIPLSANPTVNGNPLINGDVIGVFHTDFAGNVMCGGYVIWDGVNNLVLSAYCDDPTTPGVKEGFNPGEDFIWEVFTWGNTQSNPVSVTYDQSMPNIDGKYYDNGLSALTGISSFLTHNIAIPQGWSGISSYLNPVDPNLDTLLKPIINELVILMSFSGAYWPAAGLNSLINWNPYDGYLIKVTQDVILPVMGSTLSNRSVTLNPGWHIIPVLSSGNVPTASVLGVPGVVIAKEIGGNKVYWPGQGILTLLTLETGKAYIAYVNSTVTITFPAKASAGPVNSGPVVKLPSSWNAVDPNPNTHLVSIPKDICQTLENGDVIGAFNVLGINSGHAVYNGEPMAIAVYGDDAYTKGIDGLQEGDEIFFKVYRPSTDEVFALDVSFDPEMPDTEKYRTNGLSGLVLKTGVKEIGDKIRVSVYPNPASHYIIIDPGSITDVVYDIDIINTIGKVVYSTKMNADSSIRLDVSEWTEGCYFIKIKSNKTTITKKVIIRK